MTTAARQATYREVLSIREYRALFASDAASVLGDQVAAVALAVLLYHRSGSALVASLGYATAYVPWAVGGPVLSALADRLPPRRVVVGCDLARFTLIGLAAIPGLPLPVIGLLVLAAGMLAPPFDASVSALYPQVLEGDRYAVGASIRDVLHQSAQLAGFVAGGALVAVIGSHGALLLDALTFAVSAAVLWRGLSPRPAASADAAQRGLLRDAAEGLRVVTGDRRLWGPLALGILGSAYAIAPEAIAPAYAQTVGGGATTVGLIMASVAGGAVVGSLLLGRLVGPARRRRLMWPLAVAGAAPLVALSLRPPLAVSLGLLALAGAASSFQVAANTAFAAAAPAHARARAFGIAMTGMFAGQAVAIVLAGAAAQVFAPTTVIAGAGVIGLCTIVALRLAIGARRRVVDLTAAGQPRPVPADAAA